MKIVIAIATRGNDVYYKLLQFVVSQVKKYNCELIFGECGFSAEHSQRKIFGQLKGMEFDYCLLLDTDVAPSEDALDKLLENDYDIVSAPVWHFDPFTKDVHLNIGTQEGKRLYEYGRGIEIIDSTSFACLLISKRVFESLESRGEDPVKWSKLIDEKFKDRNTDNIFFAKVKALGFKICVNWDIRGSTHNRIVSLDDETIKNINERRQNV